METKDIIDALSTRLRGARGESKITNIVAGKYLGYTASAISKWVADPGKIRVVQLIRLCKLYGLDPSEALTAAISKARES